MTCPRCHAEINGASVCASCGLKVLRTVTAVMKTSVVMIAENGEENFYSSVEDVPPRQRLRLEEATSGANSGTILIADKGGRERILAQAALHGVKTPETPEPVAEAVPDTTPTWVWWAGFGLLLVAITIIVWILAK
jgi:hypothetical protein